MHERVSVTAVELDPSPTGTYTRFTRCIILLVIFISVSYIASELLDMSCDESQGCLVPEAETEKKKKDLKIRQVNR